MEGAESKKYKETRNVLYVAYSRATSNLRVLYVKDINRLFLKA